MSRTTKTIKIKNYKDDFIFSESVAKKTIKKIGREIKLNPWDRNKNKKSWFKQTKI